MRRETVVLFFAGLLTAARALRPPVTYANGAWLVGYDHGLVKRGLVGTIVAPLFEWKSPDEVRFIVSTFSLLALVFLFGGIALAVSTLAVGAESRRARWGTLACGLVVVTSPWVVMAGHLHGFLDHLVELVALGCVWIASTRARWIVALLAPIAMLTHEMFLVYGLPIVSLALVLGAPDKKARSLALVVPALAVLLVLWAHPPTPEQIEAIRAHVRSTGVLGDQASDAAVFHLEHSFRENVELQQDQFLPRLLRTDLLRVAAPPVILLLGWSVVCLWRAERRAVAVLAVPAVLAPMVLHAVAWDTERFTLMVVFQAFLLFVAVHRSVPVDDRGAVAVLGLLVTLHAIATPVPLMGTEIDGDGALLYRPRPSLHSFDGCPAAFSNAGFESGDLANWIQEGDAFVVKAGRRERGVRILWGSTGNWWVGSYGDDGTGDQRVGTIESEPFRVRGPTMLAGIGGGLDRERLRASLFVGDVEVAFASGRNRDRLRPIAWDTSAYVGQLGRIVVADRSTTRWGHLNADGFCWFRG